MRDLDIRRDVRELIHEADRLSRDAHAHARQQAAQRFASLRTAALRIDRDLGDARSTLLVAGAIDFLYQRICDWMMRAPAEEQPALMCLADLAAHLLAVESLHRQRAHAITSTTITPAS